MPLIREQGLTCPDYDIRKVDRTEWLIYEFQEGQDHCMDMAYLFERSMTLVFVHQKMKQHR
jgi:hypothetical protein